MFVWWTVADLEGGDELLILCNGNYKGYNTPLISAGNTSVETTGLGIDKRLTYFPLNSLLSHHSAVD